jgi:hypothetical protein
MSSSGMIPPTRARFLHFNLLYFLPGYKQNIEEIFLILLCLSIFFIGLLLLLIHNFSTLLDMKNTVENINEKLRNV